MYVTFLVGLTYGFAFTRFVFIASDPAWVSTHLLTPAAAGVCALLVAMAAGFVARTSRQRGAVVPPAAWTDQVLLSSIDRAVAVRPWWHLTLGAASTVGGLLGTLLGSSLWASTVTGPLALPLAALVGALIGALLAYVALCGQAGSPRPVTPASALRLLRIEDLRAQAATGDHLVGALLAGDVRAAQLEVAPVTRGAAGALRAGRPAATLVRRDVLGLRRDRFTLARAVLLTLLGCAAIAWAVLEVGAPPILAALGLVFAHFGAGAAAEGLRMSADHSGSPTLYGLSPARSALAHSVVPGALTASVWIVGAAAVLLAVGADFRSGAMTLAAVGALVTLTTGATTWLATFRPPALDAVLMPGSGPSMLVLRMLTPAAVAFLVGILAPAAAHAGAASDLLRLGAAFAVAAAWAVLRLRNALARNEA